MNNVYELFGRFKSAIIVDLDGCLCDDRHRKQWIPNKEIHGALSHEAMDLMWSEYHRGIPNDTPVPHMMSLLRFAISSDFMIIYLTGREQKFFDVTNEWLAKHVGDTSNHLIFMRPDGDRQASALFKEAMLTEIRSITDKFGIKIAAAFDDRRDIYEMYCRNGLPAVHVFDYSFGGQENLEHLIKYLANESVQAPANRTGEVPDAWGHQPIDPNKLASAAATSLSFDPVKVAETLRGMADGFLSKNGQYKNNSEVTGNVLAALFPNGVTLRTAQDHEMWHLFNLIIVKLTRFTNSGLRHQDSIFDQAIYTAMVEQLIEHHTIEVL